MRRPSFVVPLFLPLTLAACDSGGEGGRTAADIFDASVPRWTATVEAQVGGADEAEGMILVGVAGGVLLDGAFEPAGRLVVPSGWRILDLEGDRALVAFRDDIDRWVVQALRLGATP